MWRHRFRRTTVQLFLLIGMLGGLGLGYRWSLPFLIAGATGILLAIAWRRRNLVTIIVMLVFGLSLGLWRGGLYAQRLSAWQGLHYQKITLHVRAAEDAIYGKNGQMSFAAKHIRLPDGRELTGRIQLSGFGAKAIFQDDEIVATGKLYPGYGIYQGRMSYAVITVTAHHPSLLPEIRRHFVAGMQTALPEPLAPFAMGLLVGQRANLPDNIKQDLLTVGLTHIIAVSGYNLTIILQATRRVLGKRSKRMSTFLTLLLMGVFLVLAGGSASIVRAAVVSALSIWASYYGRTFRPLNLIILAAVLTAWVNPVYVWSDLSWYLSFLAFFGVMVLSPLIQARWPARWHQNIVGSVALESICAEVLALPFVLHIFGQMSRVGLVANVLVVALIPLAMLLATVAGLAGMLVPAAAGWFAWPSVLLLNYMLDTAHLLAGLPHVFVEGIGLSLWQMLTLYSCVAALIALLWRKAGKSAIITDMNETKSGSLLA